MLQEHANGVEAGRQGRSPRLDIPERDELAFRNEFVQQPGFPGLPKGCGGIRGNGPEYAVSVEKNAGAWITI